MNMLPGLGGMGGKMKGLDDEQTAEAERKMGRMEAIIHSMTPAERANPDILSPSRKHRIAKGAGVDISEVNRMIKQFNEMKKLMKQFGKPGKKKKFGFPF
jgi:signal recognition particle subunit SRP54